MTKISFLVIVALFGYGTVADKNSNELKVSSLVPHNDQRASDSDSTQQNISKIV